MNTILIRGSTGKVIYSGCFSQVLFTEGDFETIEYNDREDEYENHYPIDSNYENVKLYWFFHEKFDPQIYELQDGKWVLTQTKILHGE